MKYKKTDRMVLITQRLGGCTDRAVRRIWTDGVREYIKVNGMWFDLWKDYGHSKCHTIDTWYQPVGER